MNTPPWRIVFFGTPSFAIATLQELFKGADQLVGVVTQPDRERGRGRKVIISPVKEIALRHGLIPLQPERAKEEIFQEELRSLQPDVMVVVAYGQILPRSVLEIPKHGAINVHASLLPKYRGAAPVIWAILNGEKKTGVTTMRLDEGMDTGDVLLQAETPIGNDETGEMLRDRLAILGGQLLSQTLEKMKSGTIRPVPQDHTKATYAPPIQKEDGHIDWGKKAEEIDRQVRAFNPWPGAFTKWGDLLLKIYKGESKEKVNAERAGTVVWVGSDFIEIGTGNGSYFLKEIQLEGKKRMAVREFLSGHRIPVRTVFR